MDKQFKRQARRFILEYTMRYTKVLSEIKRIVRDTEFASYDEELNLFA